MVDLIKQKNAKKQKEAEDLLMKKRSKINYGRFISSSKKKINIFLIN